MTQPEYSLHLYRNYAIDDTPDPNESVSVRVIRSLGGSETGRWVVGVTGDPSGPRQCKIMARGDDSEDPPPLADAGLREKIEARVLSQAEDDLVAAADHTRKLQSELAVIRALHTHIQSQLSGDLDSSFIQYFQTKLKGP